MRLYRVTFKPKVSKWTVEFMTMHLIFTAIWTPAKETVGEKGKTQIKYFDTSDEAYEFVKKAGIDKVYRDGTTSMPWDATPEQQQGQRRETRALTSDEVAQVLREVLQKDRTALAAS